MNGRTLGVHSKVIALPGGFNSGVKRLTAVEVIKEINFIGTKHEEDFLLNLLAWHGFLNRKHDLEHAHVATLPSSQQVHKTNFSFIVNVIFYEKPHMIS